MDPLSRHHHLLKTFTDWTPTRSPHDGLTMLWTSPTGHEYVDHPKEHALPTAEQHGPTHPADGDSGSTTTDMPAPAHHCCPCVTPQHEGGASTAQTRTEQIRILNARRDAKEADDEQTRLEEATRTHLANRTIRTYRLGMTTEPRPEEEELTQEELIAYVDEQIAHYDSYDDFREQNNKLLKLFHPIAYQDQMAAERARLHPDPNKPPF